MLESWLQSIELFSCGCIDENLLLFQVMTWGRTSNKSLPQLMMTQFSVTQSLNHIQPEESSSLMSINKFLRLYAPTQINRLKISVIVSISVTDTSVSSVHDIHGSNYLKEQLWFFYAVYTGSISWFLQMFWSRFIEHSTKSLFYPIFQQ